VTAREVMPVRHHPVRPAVIAPLVAALATMACFLGPTATDDPAASPSTPPGAAGPVDVEEPDGTKTVEEFARDINASEQVAEAYWEAQLSASGVAFRPVARVIPYQRAGEVDCGGQPFGLRNAAYCSVGDFIAYDVNWAFAVFREIGDAFIFFLLGHEYAHAIQVRLGVRAEFTIQQELQADCMAGAYLGDSERAGQLRVQQGDIEEFQAGLIAVGDPPDQPWFAEGSHGTAEQRTQAFANGYERSLEPCGLR